jgi:hypothetical protein
MNDYEKETWLEERYCCEECEAQEGLYKPWISKETI